jgi:uncharacterized BrkB/YihY/UPF0761 family membrane protein
LRQSFHGAEDWSDLDSYQLMTSERVSMEKAVSNRLVTKIWQIAKDTGYGFVEDEALTRGAAIAFYTATSIAPVLLIAIAIAAVAFGQDAAQNAITAQLSGLMGDQAAQLLQAAVANAAKKSSEPSPQSLEW